MHSLLHSWQFRLTFSMTPACIPNHPASLSSFLSWKLHFTSASEHSKYASRHKHALLLNLKLLFHVLLCLGNVLKWREFDLSVMAVRARISNLTPTWPEDFRNRRRIVFTLELCMIGDRYPVMWKFYVIIWIINHPTLDALVLNPSQTRFTRS